jgi:polysaccharide deacetylase family sporulation protein PdaB
LYAQDGHNLVKKISYGDRNVKGVAITFDDGPHKDFAGKILNILEEYDVKATFFVVGKMVKINPSLVEAISAAGHEIGSHTFNHFDMTTLDKDGIVKELQMVKDDVRKITGHKINIFRPPYGRYNSRVLDIANELGYTMVLWQINSGDYGCDDYRKIKQRILNNVRSGDIILMHSGVPATIEALPQILSVLKKKGFSFFSISELIEIYSLHAKNK